LIEKNFKSGARNSEKVTEKGSKAGHENGKQDKAGEKKKFNGAKKKKG